MFDIVYDLIVTLSLSDSFYIITDTDFIRESEFAESPGVISPIVENIWSLNFWMPTKIT